MADEIVGVLQELSSLLRRLTEQNEATSRRAEGMDLSGKTRAEESKARLEASNARMGELKANMERIRQWQPEFSQRVTRNREEDLKFRQRLLEEIERHNQLLETLIARMGRL